MKRKVNNLKLSELSSYIFDAIPSSEFDDIIDLRLLRDGLPLEKLGYLECIAVNLLAAIVYV